MDRNVKVMIALLVIVSVAVSWAVLPAQAQSIAESTDLLYVADYNHDIVHVYNVTSPSFSKVAAITVEKPSKVVASHDGGHVYVASSGILNSAMYVLSTDNHTILEKYTLPDNGADSMGISTNDQYVYVVTSTRFIVLDTSTGKLTEHPLDTDHYTTIATANDAGTEMAFFTSPGSSKLLVFNGKEGSINSFHLNCEAGQLETLDGTHLLSTDKLGEINVLRYYYVAGTEGWSYTPHPIGGKSVLYVPHLALSNDRSMAYLIETENSKVYKVNMADYTSVLLTNASEWRSPTRAVFSSDDSKIFICDDTGVIGLYTGNNSQYRYFYGYKALDVAIATIRGIPVATAQPTPSATATPRPSPAPDNASVSATANPTPGPTSGTGGGICPTLAVLPLLIAGFATAGRIKARLR